MINFNDTGKIFYAQSLELLLVRRKSSNRSGLKTDGRTKWNYWNDMMIMKFDVHKRKNS